MCAEVFCVVEYVEEAAEMRRDGTEYVEMVVLLLILCRVKHAGVSCVWEGMVSVAWA